MRVNSRCGVVTPRGLFGVTWYGDEGNVGHADAGFKHVCTSHAFVRSRVPQGLFIALWLKEAVKLYYVVKNIRMDETFTSISVACTATTSILMYVRAR